MPGGPIKVRMAPERLSSSIPFLAELGSGDVLDDAVAHVLETGVVLVQDLARVLRVEALLGALAPRHREQPVEVVADHRRLGRLVAHALEPRELAVGLDLDVLGHLGLGDLLPVLLDDRSLVLAQLLADRVELAAQDVLALLLLDSGLDVVLDALADLHQRQSLTLKLEGQLEPRAHVDGLEQPHLLLERDVGGVAGRVREGAGLGDRAYEGRDPAVVAAQLQDLLDHRAILTLELADPAVCALRPAVPRPRRTGDPGCRSPQPRDGAMQGPKEQLRGRRRAGGSGR